MEVSLVSLSGAFIGGGDDLKLEMVKNPTFRSSGCVRVLVRQWFPSVRVLVTILS